jgi:predicted ATPase/class 3 adenylate cyclase
VLACAAALGMQRRMAGFAAIPTRKGPFQLRLRVAAHSGQVFAVEVGDPSHIELVVTGPAISRVMMAQESAAPDQVIISEETYQALEDAQAQLKLTGLYSLQDLTSVPAPPPAPPPIWRPGTPSLNTMRALLHRVRALHAYLPHSLPDRFIRLNAEGGEFRPVTLLFANFYAFSKLLALIELSALVERDMEIVGRVLNSYYRRTQAIIQRYGGSVNKVDMATFGDRLIALFGAPTAHEDDSERAVQAALEIRATLGGANQEIAALLQRWIAAHPEQRSLLRLANVVLHQRIGIASGTVFAGVVGTPQRHEYTVIGEAVHVAARTLAAANDGEVLLTSMTHRATRHLVEVEPLARLPLTHAAQPVPVFRVVRARGAVDPAADTLQATPLIGRQAELSQILEIAQSALATPAPAGRIVALVGDPGVGKSRLADEALHALQAAALDAKLVREGCHSYEQTIPYAVITRLLRQVFDLRPTEDRMAQAVVVLQSIEDLAPAWGRFTALLGQLLNLPFPETTLTHALTLEQRRDRLQDLIVMICLAVARRRPLVLVVDDLQWADATSQALIERLAIVLAGYPLLLMLIYRPSPDLAEPWRELSHASTITLGELARADSEMLLAALLGGEPSDQLLPLIERAHGTPLFLEEIVRYLIETGSLQRDRAGNWNVVRPVDSSTVPVQVEQLITARVDRLDDDTRALLQTAAVIGQRFSEDLLVAVSQQPGPAAPRLAELVSAALLAPDQSAPTPTYTFKHALIHDVAYSSMLFTHRQQIHEHIAAVIAKRYAGELDEQQAVLAHHELRAGHPDRAYPHLIKAALLAQTRYAHKEALSLYQQALAIAPWRDHQNDETLDIQEASLLHENTGDLLALTGDYAGARSSYEQLLALIKVRKIEDRSVRQAALERKIGSTYENQGDLAQALSWLSRAAEMIAEEAPSDAVLIEHARVLSDIGWVYFRQHELEQAHRHLEQALATVESYQSHEEQARILNRLGGIAYTRGDMALALHYVEQSLSASEQSGNLVDQAWALNNLGVLTESQGRTDDSIRYGLRAIETNERTGNRRGLAFAANNVGFAYYVREEYQRAREYCTLALEKAAEVHDSYAQMFALLNLGRVQTALADRHAAAQAAQQSISIALQLNLPLVQLEGRVILAELALQSGDVEAAVDQHRQGLALVTDTESEEYGRFQRLEAELAFAQGDRARAVALLKANEALFTRLQEVSEAQRTRKLLAGMIGSEAPVI